MQIRTAGPADLTALLALIEAFYVIDGHPFDADYLTPALVALLDSDEHGVVGVATLDGAAAGYAIVTWGYSLEGGGKEALLDEIYADQRGIGVGRQLMAWVESVSAKHGAKRITLETEVPNDRARAFYQRLGYEIDESVWLAKWLTGESSS